MKQPAAFLYLLYRIAKNGFKGEGTLVSKNETETRRNICNGCEHKDGDMCKECGCYLPLKVRFTASQCPLEKW
jgi:hypothetical protein